MIVRLLNILIYALFTGIGGALLARPLFASVRAVVRPYSLEPDLAAPWLWIALALLLFLAFADVVRRLLARRRVGLARYLALLVLVALIGAFRKGVTASLRPGVDDALANFVARVELSASKSWERDGRYPQDARLLSQNVPALVRDLGFRKRGARSVRGEVIVVQDTHGPVLAPIEGVDPGDVVFAVDPERRSYWVTAFTLGRQGFPTAYMGPRGRVFVATGRDGQPATRLDPLFPEYPNKTRGRSPIETPHESPSD